MASVTYKFTTQASTNLQAVRAGQVGNLTSISIANVATAIYVKLYWTNTTPTVGTTVPAYTMGAAASANVNLTYTSPLTGNGQLWVAVTAAAADGDSGNAASGAVVTLGLE